MPRLSPREFEAKLSETLQAMREEARPFEGKSPEARARRLAKAKQDHIYFAKTYLPHYFYEGFAPFHPAMSEAAQVAERPVIIASAGGFGKSSLVTIVEALHAVVFKTAPFIVIGGMTEDLAAQSTAMVKVELEENERILQDFGHLKGKWKWEDGDFATRQGVRVKARGAGQAFRGLRWRQYRPSLVLLDDIEDDDLAVSPRRVQKVLTWILATVLPRLEARGWRLVLVGNVINRTGVIGTLLFHPEYKEWLRRVFPAMDKRGRPTWPERFPTKVLSTLKRILGFVRFAREMMCAPVDDSHYFQPEKTQAFPHSKLRDMKDVIVFIDPSVLASRQGDYKAVVGIGRAAEDDPREYLCACWIRHATIYSMVEACYRINEELHPKVFALESNGFQEHLKRDFDRAALVHGYCLPLAPVTSKENKGVRIERLVPLHDSGDLLFCREIGDTPLLLEQLYAWEPLGREHDDGPDGAAGAMDYRRGKRRKARFRSL